VNPYIFVGLPTHVKRSDPVGHGEVGTSADPLWFGTISTTWTLHSPMLLPQVARAERWIAEDGHVVIPGSSMKGALRSLHETLFAGCLRVVDDGFVPGYRDAARSDQQTPNSLKWQLAVVNEARDGTPLGVTLCTDEVWVEATSLRDKYPLGMGLPRSGDVVNVVGEKTWSEVGEREEVRCVDKVRDVVRLDSAARSALDKNSTGDVAESLDGRVLLVTDTSVRSKKRANGAARGRCYWATGAVGGQDVRVAEEAVTGFRRACAGSRDLQVLLAGGVATKLPWKSETTFKEVCWWPSAGGAPDNYRKDAKDIGLRAHATGLLHVGDVVWVRVADQGPVPEVVELKLSAIWRHVGGNSTLGQRLPGAARDAEAVVLPCRHPFRSPGASEADGFPVGLCLSCQIFGSADTVGTDRGTGQQSGYAGKVRVGRARSTAPVETTQISLAPMGAPSPGAGAFYLVHREIEATRKSGDRLGQWGSDSDKEKPRQMRGRKFYWHGDPDEQARYWERDPGVPDNRVVPRYEARRHHRSRPTDARVADRSLPVQLVPAGTTFEQTLHVDGLDETALATLLAAVEPRRVLDLIRGGSGRTFAGRLGGGKAFGLGSVMGQVTVVAVQTAQARYGAEGVSNPTPNLEMSRDRLARLLTVGRLSRQLGQVVRVLDTAGLGDWRTHLSYPPGAGWTGVGSEGFDKSFTFFSEYSGEQLARTAKPYYPLPVLPNDPLAVFDPTLPVAGQRTRNYDGRQR
jgi:RAMP superfamily